MKKEGRIKLWNKYGRRCAYCGKKLEYKSMQADHIIPKYNGGGNNEENYNPSCRQCNKKKDTFTLEGFRRELQTEHERARRYSSNYRFALKYGQIIETPKPIIFWFEKY